MGIDCGIVGSHHMCHGENKVLPYTVMVTHTILDILMIGIEIPLKMHWIFPSPFLGKHPIFWPWHTKPYHCKSDIQKTKYRKSPYLMRKTMVSCRFSLKPIHWDIPHLPSRVPAPDGGPRAKVSSLRGPDGFPGDFGGFP
jgi:hypothetical protein